MKKTLLNSKRNEYRFDLSFEEVRHRLYECVSPCNSGLKETDIKKAKNAKEYIANFKRGNEDVSLCIGINNLKRYFGSWNITIKDDGGISIIRVLPTIH